MQAPIPQELGTVSGHSAREKVLGGQLPGTTQLPIVDPHVPFAWQVLRTFPYLPPVQVPWEVSKALVAIHWALSDVSAGQRFPLLFFFFWF